MKKYIYFVVVLLFFSCNKNVLKINKAQNFTESEITCNIENFNIYDYFREDRITRFEYEVKRFERLDALKRPADSVIVFVGSSSIRKWHSLEKSFLPLTVINRGFGGSTYPELIYYSQQLVFQYNPSIVVVYEGDNDQYFLSPFEIFECASYFEKILHEKFPDTELFFMSAKPAPSRRIKIRSTIQTNNYLKTIAQNNEKTYYIDVFDPMFDENKAINGDLFKKDSLHLNEKGYQLWYDIIFPEIEKKVTK